MQTSAIFIKLVLASLVVWRLTQLLSSTDKSRNLTDLIVQNKSSNFWGRAQALLCCIALWIASPAAIFLNNGFVGLALHWLAIAAAAFLLEETSTDAYRDAYQKDSGKEILEGDMPCAIATIHPPLK